MMNQDIELIEILSTQAAHLDKRGIDISKRNCSLLTLFNRSKYIAREITKIILLGEAL